jgi:hypothetical protein
VLKKRRYRRQCHAQSADYLAERQAERLDGRYGENCSSGAYLRIAKEAELPAT